MRLCDWLKGSPPYQDAELGVLVRSGKYWEAKLSLGDHASLPVRIA